ncbi:hypothetical protein [Nocardia macrotermitis]|uniref:hypothetical protein n=1 Tax=Nocardia macrotermitis TaxID=2585198 RepID=UPI001D102060|nr:hypothetical protein [Nocardia macrotermitis]
MNFLPSLPHPVTLRGEQFITHTTETLIRDVGTTAGLGGLSRARQLEETAGFVIALAFQGIDPRAAVPHAPAQ